MEKMNRVRQSIGVCRTIADGRYHSYLMLPAAVANVNFYAKRARSRTTEISMNELSSFKVCRVYTYLLAHVMQVFENTRIRI